jgi:hypothetical protein
LGRDDFNTHNGYISLETIIEGGKVSSPIVQDFRNIEKIKKLPIDLTKFESELLPSQIKLQSLGNDSMAPTKKIAYFSDILLSRDRLGRAKFAFAVDYRKLIQDASNFENFYKNFSSSKKDVLSDLSSIRSVTLKRRRINTASTNNRLGNPQRGQVIFDKESTIPEVIFETGGDKLNDFMMAKNSAAGIQEVDVAAKNRSGIRFFTGFDESISELQDGIFQYGVEMVVEDRTREYLASLLTDLSNDRKALFEYYTEGTRVGVTNHDPHTDTYIQELSEIQNSSGNYNLNSDKFTQSFIKSRINKVNVWKQPVENYFKILSTITNTNSISKKSLINMTHPEKASPKSVMAMIKAIDNLITRLSDAVGSNEMSKSRNDQEREAQSYTSSNSSKTIKIENWFINDDFDTNPVKNIGYEYLSTSVPDSGTKTETLKIISTDYYKKRIVLASSANYVRENINHGYSALPPTYCYLGDKVFDFTTTGLKEHYNVEAAILAHNATSITPTALNVGHDDIKLSMFELYSNLNLTITTEDGRDIIKPIQPIDVEYQDPDINPNELYLSLMKPFSTSGATNEESTDNPFVSGERNEISFAESMVNNVEVLVGLKSKKLGMRIKSFEWEPLTAERIKKLKSKKTVLICRLSPNKTQSKGLKLPVFDSYFMLSAKGRG